MAAFPHSSQGSKTMNLFTRQFFAVAAVVILSGCASTSNLELNPNTKLSNFVIANIEVVNETGESFEGIVVEEVLSQEIKGQLSALGLDSGSGAPATMKVNIIQYEKGNAVARWIMPGLGKTILSVEGEILGADGSLIASSQATETVGAGGLYTIGAWKQVFEKVARSLATDLAAAK